MQEVILAIVCVLLLAVSIVLELYIIKLKKENKRLNTVLSLPIEPVYIKETNLVIEKIRHKVSIDNRELTAYPLEMIKERAYRDFGHKVADFLLSHPDLYSVEFTDSPIIPDCKEIKFEIKIVKL